MDYLYEQLTSTSPTLLLVGSVGVILLLQEVHTLIKRLYLSPIAHIPGPKLAAATLWYQFYFDVIKRGKFLWEIERLHRIYGPIVRIGPNEVHILDPDYYDILYANAAARRDKDGFLVQGFGLMNSVLATESHDVHKTRRAALSPYFSKASVMRLEQLITAKIDLFCRRLVDFQESDEPVNFEVAFTALTTDIITEYCFAKSHDFLSQPGFSPAWTTAIRGSCEASNLGRYWPAFLGFIKLLPPWVVGAIDANMKVLVDFTLAHERQVADVASGTYDDKKSTLNHRTIIHELLEGDLPPQERTVARVAEEAQLIVAAGAVTTTHFLRTCLFFLLDQPEIMLRLKAEINEIMPDPTVLPPCHKLEKLPYLTAVIKETGRMTSGVSSRLARVSPYEDLRYRHWTIPMGTVIGMSQPLQHMNPATFPRPMVFDPERWLGGQESVKLETYLVNFSKGARGCLGINLAKAELYLTLAALVRRLEFALYETERERDVDTQHDFFLPYASVNSKGVRVLVKGSLGV